MPLTAERTALASVDEQLAELLLKRAQILKNIARIKTAVGITIVQSEEWNLRQSQRVALLQSYPPGDRTFVLRVFDQLHEASIVFQQSQTCQEK